MRRRILDEDSDTDRWMVSYADFITLLFAFFVVMYAISSVNNEKYRVLSATLADAFAVQAATPDPIQIGEPTLSASPHIIDLPDNTAFADQDDGDTFIEDPIDEAKSLLGGFAAAEGIAVESNNDWVELKVDASVLFANGQAELSAAARVALQPAVTLLANSTTPVTIEGYTDNVPTSSVQYPSNWEMSAARSAAVARFFVEQGVRAERMTAVGYGENHPIATNATSNGRASNRRIVVVLARRTDISRNLNSNPQASAFAVVRSTPINELSDELVQQRTESGGLLIRREPEAVNSAPQN